MSDRDMKRRTKTSDEIEALLRESAPGAVPQSEGRMTRAVTARLHSDTALRRRGGGGLDAWDEDDGHVPRWFIGAVAAAVLALVAWITLGPSGQVATNAPGGPQPIAGNNSEITDLVPKLDSVPGRLWMMAQAEPLKREAKALMDAAGVLAERVVSGVPTELFRSEPPSRRPAPKSTGATS